MTARPLTIGLTGGIGSGKSSVARAFAALGVPLLCTDTIARELVELGQPALGEIVARFGTGVLRPDGQLDRSALRQLVFTDEASRRALESILHPRIRAEVLARISAHTDAPYLVIDIPLLAESAATYRPLLNRILVVDCDAATRHRRVMLRDGTTAEQTDAMLAAQASDSDRLALADDVIVNRGSLEELADQVSALDRRYRTIAAN